MCRALALPPSTLHPGVPSLGSLTDVGTAIRIRHREPKLSGFAMRGIGKMPQILEWFEEKAWFGAKHPRKSTLSPPRPCSHGQWLFSPPHVPSMSSQGVQEVSFHGGFLGSFKPMANISRKGIAKPWKDGFAHDNNKLHRVKWQWGETRVKPGHF